MSTNSEDSLVKAIGGCAVIIIVLIFSFVLTIYQGVIITSMWSWFIMPTFHVQDISIAMACGLSVFISLFRHSSKKVSSEDAMASCVTALLTPSLLWFVAWVIHSYFIGR